MATSRIGVPEDPELRRFHLLGLRSGLEGWDDGDVAAARPLLNVQACSQFDGGRAVGLMMSARNDQRKKALQQGRPGLMFRVKQRILEKWRRKLPELP